MTHMTMAFVTEVVKQHPVSFLHLAIGRTHRSWTRCQLPLQIALLGLLATASVTFSIQSRDNTMQQTQKAGRLCLQWPSHNGGRCWGWPWQACHSARISARFFQSQWSQYSPQSLTTLTFLSYTCDWSPPTCSPFQAVVVGPDDLYYINLYKHHSAKPGSKLSKFLNSRDSTSVCCQHRCSVNGSQYPGIAHLANAVAVSLSQNCYATLFCPDLFDCAGLLLVNARMDMSASFDTWTTKAFQKLITLVAFQSSKHQPCRCHPFAKSSRKCHLTLSWAA